jgi:RsiW-degrading membrane proteinase PrsW (M82 family)
VFRSLVTTSTPGWSFLVDIIAYIFTCVIGTSFAVFVESFWVQIGVGPLLKSTTLNIAVPSLIAFVGFTEEIAKQIVVYLGAAFVRKRRICVRASEFMIMGVSSGLGFSAIENISYVQKGIMNEVVHSVVGEGVVIALSRALYTPFLHGMWAGIAAFGLGIVTERGARFWWSIPLFLMFSAIGHGFYDAVISTHVFWALLDVAISYFLFLVLLLNGIRLKQKID